MHSVQKNVENSGIFDVLVRPQTALELDQEATNVLTIAEIWGMITRFFTRISVDLFPTWTRFFLSGLIELVQTRLGRDDGRGIPKMSPMLTDLMQQLQDVYTYHPGDDGRLMVAVPTTPHTIEQFEVREVHHDGPSVVLHCQPLQDEQARHQEEEASPPAKKTRTCVHNDYEDLL